jgi:hypothetical protein
VVSTNRAIAAGVIVSCGERAMRVDCRGKTRMKSFEFQRTPIVPFSIRV